MKKYIIKYLVKGTENKESQESMFIGKKKRAEKLCKFANKNFERAKHWIEEVKDKDVRREKEEEYRLFRHKRAYELFWIRRKLL